MQVSAGEVPGLGRKHAPSLTSVHPPARILQVGPWTGNWGQEDGEGPEGSPRQHWRWGPWGAGAQVGFCSVLTHVWYTARSKR